MTQIRVPTDVAKTDRSNTWTGTQDFTAATVLGVAGGGGGTVSGATAAAAGVVQLAGDLSGTYQAPTVPGLTGKADKAALAAVATTGAYADLTGRPALATVATTGAYGDLTGRPALATVATTGAYGDLSGRPVIPAAPLVAYKLADTLRSVTGYALDPDLQIGAVPVGVYAVELLYSETASGTAGFSLAGLGGTATVAGIGSASLLYGYSSGSSALAYMPSASWPASATAIAPNGTADTAVHVGQLRGLVTVTVAGSLGVQWAPSAAGNVTLRAGSLFRLTRVN